jgi:hypothetical protein
MGMERFGIFYLQGSEHAVAEVGALQIGFVFAIRPVLGASAIGVNPLARI